MQYESVSYTHLDVYKRQVYGTDCEQLSVVPNVPSVQNQLFPKGFPNFKIHF